MTTLNIGEQKISHPENIFFIAEIGINHNGSIENAKKLIDMAKTCGADAVKFQKRTPQICVPENIRDRIRETPWGEMTYFEYKKRIEFGREEYDIINDYCKNKDIMWSASAWDLPSLEFVESYDVPFHKVASAMLTHRDLLEEIRKTGKPVLLSTGMSTEKQINQAVDIFGEDYPLAILHCNSEYPAEDEALNLSYINELEKMYPKKAIGYSGHELGISASLVAGVIGAQIIERHITLDRAMWGSDQAASIEMSGLRRLIRDLQKFPVWLGDGQKKVTEGEKRIKDKLRYVSTL